MTAVITFNADAPAVDCMLALLELDPRFAYIVRPGTRAYKLLTQAGADHVNVPVEQFRRELEMRLEFQTVPAIGSRS